MTDAATDLRRQLGMLLGQGRAADAVALLTTRSQASDATAQYELGLWRLYGQSVERDPSAALDLFRDAAAQHHPEAVAAEIALLGNGMAGTADPAAAQARVAALAASDPFYRHQQDLLEQIAAAPLPPAEVLSVDPDIRFYSDFLPPALCDHVMEAARVRLAPSFVIDPVSRQRLPHPVRTSHGANFGPVDEDCVINAINRRIAAVTGTDLRAGEMLHVLRYTPGQQYRLHHDGLPNVSNQRQWTAIVYLNHGFDGGATDFPLLGLNVAPRRGGLLVFANTHGDGAIDRRTRHEGKSVDTGEKWVATRWIRTRPWSPWDDGSAR